MPTYVYRCEQCSNVIERRQSFSEAPLTECESCQGRLQRVLQPVGIIFKGSGFYSTDYRGGSSTAANGAGETAESASESSKESTSTPKTAESSPSTTKDSGASSSTSSST